MSKLVVGLLCASLLSGAGVPTGERVTPAKSAPVTARIPEAPAPAAPEPLTAEEEQALAAHSEEPGEDVAGGALSNLHLTYIVIALAAAVLVMVLK